MTSPAARMSLLLAGSVFLAPHAADAQHKERYDTAIIIVNGIEERGCQSKADHEANLRYRNDNTLHLKEYFGGRDKNGCPENLVVFVGSPEDGVQTPDVVTTMKEVAPKVKKDIVLINWLHGEAKRYTAVTPDGTATPTIDSSLSMTAGMSETGEDYYSAIGDAMQNTRALRHKRLYNIMVSCHGMAGAQSAAHLPAGTMSLVYSDADRKLWLSGYKVPFSHDDEACDPPPRSGRDILLTAFAAANSQQVDSTHCDQKLLIVQKGGRHLPVTMNGQDVEVQIGPNPATLINPLDDLARMKQETDATPKAVNRAFSRETRNITLPADPRDIMDAYLSCESATDLTRYDMAVQDGVRLVVASYRLQHPRTQAILPATPPVVANPPKPPAP